MEVARVVLHLSRDCKNSLSTVAVPFFFAFGGGNRPDYKLYPYTAINHRADGAAVWGIKILNLFVLYA